MIDPGKIRRGDGITARYLNGLAKLATMAGNWSIAKPLEMLETGDSRLVRWNHSSPIRAQITAYNSSTHAYSWVEVYHKGAGSWPVLVGGRTGTYNAFEANLYLGVPIKSIVELKPGYGGTSNDYRFEYLRAAAAGNLSCSIPSHNLLLTVTFPALNRSTGMLNVYSQDIPLYYSARRPSTSIIYPPCGALESRTWQSVGNVDLVAGDNGGSRWIAEGFNWTFELFCSAQGMILMGAGITGGNYNGNYYDYPGSFIKIPMINNIYVGDYAHNWLLGTSFPGVLPGTAPSTVIPAGYNPLNYPVTRYPSWSLSPASTLSPVHLNYIPYYPLPDAGNREFTDPYNMFFRSLVVTDPTP